MADVDVGLDQAGEQDRPDRDQRDAREARERGGEQPPAIGGLELTGRPWQDEEQRRQAAEPDCHRADVDDVDREVEGHRGLRAAVPGERRDEDDEGERGGE